MDGAWGAFIGTAITVALNLIFCGFFFGKITQQLTGACDDIKDHEKRIRQLEMGKGGSK